MTPPGPGILDFVGPTLFLSFIVWMFWALWQRSKGAKVVPDDPPGTPYRVYTREFDRVAAARDVPGLLTEADRGLPPAEPLTVRPWPARLAAVERLTESAAPVFAEATERLAPLWARPRGKTTIMLLIDQ